MNIKDYKWSWVAIIINVASLLLMVVYGIRTPNEAKPHVNNITIVDLTRKYTNIVTGSHTYTVRSNTISIELDSGNSILIPVSENYKITVH